MSASRSSTNRELHFASAIREQIQADASRLRRYMWVRLAYLALGVAAVFAWRTTTALPDYLDRPLLACTAAAAGIAASMIAMNAPVLVANVWLSRQKERVATPPTRLKAVAATLVVLPFAIPALLAASHLYMAGAILFAMIPLAVFVSNSLLLATTRYWSGELAQIALAQQWDREAEEDLRLLEPLRPISRRPQT